MVDEEGPRRHGTVARDGRRVTSWYFRSGSADVTRSLPPCFTCLRLSLSRARDCFSSALVLPPPPPPPPPLLLLLRRDHVIFGIGNARRDTLSLCRRLTLHRRRFIDVNGLISPVPGHGTSDHVGGPASPLQQRGEVQIDGRKRIIYGFIFIWATTSPPPRLAIFRRTLALAKHEFLSEGPRMFKRYRVGERFRRVLIKPPLLELINPRMEEISFTGPRLLLRGEETAVIDVLFRFISFYTCLILEWVWMELGLGASSRFLLGRGILLFQV